MLLDLWCALAELILYLRGLPWPGSPSSILLRRLYNLFQVEQEDNAEQSQVLLKE